MHSFLSKVFGRKKDEKEPSPTSLRPGELLDGKFEAVSPNVSPSANNFLELDPKANGQEAQDKEKDGVFSLFRAKSRPSSPEVKPKKLTDTLPQLSLNFPGLDESSNAQAIDSLLELDIDAQILLSDAVIGQRRLNPLEAIILIRACSQAIVSRGLETLGIMHPHWYSASPDIQRKLISQFIHTLTPQNQMPTPLSPTLVTPFETELGSRSPHDIAAILRWGLRHLRLDGEHFGTDEGWYKAFLDAEAAASYPPKAFSEKLAPKLPSAHLDLLIATLEIFSSLAAHAEENGTSGHKLSKIFGLWLLTARQVEDQDDWFSFYRRWERTGRMLEHLYLARIRDESADQRMPLRLLELVRKYPYTQGLSSPTTDLQLLPPSKFTTQQHDALFVRIEVELPTGKRKPKTKIHPLNLLADAFSINVKEGEFVEIWAKITAASKNGSSLLPLSNVFADETIRFLSIIPDPNSTKGAKSPVFSVASPSLPRAQSFSAAETDKPVVTSLHTKPATDPFPLTPVSASDIGSDWDQFSSSGFLDNSPGIIPLVSTLFDNDVEKTVPPDPVLSRKSSRRNKTAPSRKSVDFSAEPLAPTPPRDKAPSESEVKTIVRASKLEIIQIDEAFIDFWSDSLLDPITSTWPTFIICKFKSSLIPQLTYGPVQEGHQQKTMKWLVLEQVFTVRPPSPPPQSVESAEAIVIPASPTPSTSSRKRFSFFTRTSSSSSVGSQKGKKKEKALKIGEMGELLEEETSGPQIFSPPRMSFSRSRKSTDKKAAETVAKPDGNVEAVTEKPADAAGVEPPAPENSLPEAVPVATATAATVAAVGAVTIGATIASAAEDKPVELQKVETEHKGEVPAADAEKEVSAVEDIPVEDKEADRKGNEGIFSPNAEKDEDISQEVNDVQRTLEVEAETSEVESTAKPPGIEPIEVAPSVKEVTKSLSSSEDAGRIQEDELDIAHADFSTGAPSTGGIAEDAEQVVVPVEKIQEESSVAVDTAGVLAPPVEVVSVEAGGQAPITPDAEPTIANDNGHPEGSSNFVGEAFPEATESLPEVAEEAAIPSPAVFTSNSSDLENKPIVAEAKDSASLKDENVTESEGPVYSENIALQHTLQTEGSPSTSVELDVVETAVDESIPLHSSELADDSGIPKVR